MTDKITLTKINSDYASKQAVNANYDTIVAGLNNTLSRDGTAPNQMGANLDMNSNRILNLPAPATNTEPLRKGDAQSYVDAATAAVEAAEAASAIAQSSASSASTSASTASTAAQNAVSAYTGVQGIVTEATTLSNQANSLWSSIQSYLTNLQNSVINWLTGASVDLSVVPNRKVTANTTALLGDVEIECDTTSAGFVVTVPLTLGNLLVKKRIRIYKSAGNYPVTISSDGSTPFAYIININDSGGGGWLDVEVNGSVMKVFGIP